MNHNPILNSDPASTEYLSHMNDVAKEDVGALVKAQTSYGNSWKQRGGVGAFMMLARKWDRIEQRMGQTPVLLFDSDITFADGGDDGDRFDILQHLMADDRPEGVIDDIRDLRRYLILIESEARAMRIPACAGPARSTVESSDESIHATQ